jgi:hypothetical protein
MNELRIPRESGYLRELAEYAQNDPVVAADVFGSLENFENLLPQPHEDEFTLLPELPKAPGHLNVRDIHRFYGAVSWEWPLRIPKGQVTLLVGETGMGKSWLICALIAAHLGVISYPDGQHGAGERVVFVETEEMRGAISERLLALGVDKVEFLLNDELDPTYAPSLTKDADRIVSLAKHTNATLIVVDSLSGGHALDENGSDMRQVLLTLARIASVTGCPVLVAHHLRKRNAFEDGSLTLDRVRGSSTITQFCRSVFGLWRPDPASGVVRVEQIKNSFAPPAAPFGFQINDGKFLFCDAPEPPREMTAADRAVEFLRIELRAGPRRFSELLEKAEAEGISQATLYRAKPKAGVVAVDGKWALPYNG